MNPILRSALFAVWVVVAAACASENSSAGASGAVASNSTDKVVCKKERTTGTYVRKRVCRSEAQMEEEREAWQRALREKRGSTGDQSL